MVMMAMMASALPMLMENGYDDDGDGVHADDTGALGDEHVLENHDENEDDDIF